MFFLTFLLLLVRPFFAEGVFPRPFLYYQILVGMVVAFHLIFNRTTRQFVSHPLVKVWGFWVVISAVSLLIHFQKHFPWQEWFSAILGGMFFLLSATYASTDQRRQWLVAALLIGTLGTLVFASIQWNVDYPYLRQQLDQVVWERVIGPFFSPDLFASYLVMMFFVAVSFSGEMKNKFLWMIPAATLVALFFTRSLGAWLSLLIAVAFLMGRLPMGRVEKKRLGVFVILLVLIGAMLLFQRLQVTSEHASLKNSTLQRLYFWKSGWEMFCYAPFSGIGFTRFDDVYSLFQQPGAFESRYAHNILIQLLAEFGIWGGLWLCGVIRVVVKMAKQQDKVLVMALIVFLIHSLVDYGFSIPQVSDHWWMIAGLTQTQNSKVKRQNYSAKAKNFEF